LHPVPVILLTNFYPAAFQMPKFFTA